MSIELKIKSKHLGVESQIIRFEERKLKERIKSTKSIEKIDELQSTLQSIAHHRRWDVRNENRATFLARAFLAGKPYTYAEQKRKPEHEYMFNRYIIPRIVAMVVRYGKGDQRKIDASVIQDWSSF